MKHLYSSSVMAQAFSCYQVIEAAKVSWWETSMRQIYRSPADIMWRLGEMNRSMCLETELGLPGNLIQGLQKHSRQDL